jgi:hypothetical protein
MKTRPTIFISGVSSEFGSFRDAVENEVEKKGCFAENQPGFHPDPSTVEEMLRRRLHDSDAVIHIAGFRFGAEPNQRPADATRRSYTQMEFDIARELQKPVYVFLSAEPSVRQPPKPDEQPEDAEATALQRAHRDAVQATNQLYYFFKDQAELCRLVAEIPIVAQADFRADISRIVKYAPTELVGREAETAVLDDAWLKVRRAESLRPRILTFVALGGEGKTSLVAKWAAGLAHQGWPGCDAAFAWSFYSQGTREQMAASADLFLKEALVFFGDEKDKEFAAAAAGPFEKGERLARVVGRRRCLLILDGLEPLQYSPASPTPGELKDKGLAALLKGLATGSLGLCVVTTRASLPDLRAFWQTTAPETPLARLSRAAGVDLLQRLGVRRDSGSQAEFERLVEDVKGHALTLTLLGGFLGRAFRGDIRQRDRVRFEKADEKIDGGHALRTMAAYEQWLLSDGGDEGRREVAVLRLMGLFDRPADAGCLAALRAQPAIPGLTEPLAGLADDDWEFALSGLEAAKLLTVNRDSTANPQSAIHHPQSLDAHPHLREYFAKQVREQNPEGWRAAHRRLYEHLCATTPDKPQPTLEDLQPLYQAVAHGCQAGLQQEACEKVYRDRIQRGREAYSTKKLGVVGADLGAVACFFEQPWLRISPTLTKPAQAWLLGEVSFSLRALGRLAEALEPIRTGLVMSVQQKNWEVAAVKASNLSELELTLGEVSRAVGEAEQSVTYADRSGDADWPRLSRTTHADALHQAGRRAEALARFREAEQMQANRQPHYPLLYSLQGFKYCDLLLAAPERAAWQKGKSEVGSRKSELIEACRVVSQRAAQTLKWAEQNRAALLTTAIEHLTLGRATLYKAILEKSADSPPPDLAGPDSHQSRSRPAGPVANQPSTGLRLSEPSLAQSELDQAVAGHRRAAHNEFIVRCLLTRAWLRVLTGARTGPESAQSDLDEAWEIAARGPMRLHLADIHLTRARLFGGIRDEGGGMKYPWESPEADLAAAEELINACGYHRRDEELADAKQAILGQASR